MNSLKILLKENCFMPGCLMCFHRHSFIIVIGLWVFGLDQYGFCPDENGYMNYSKQASG